MDVPNQLSQRSKPNPQHPVAIQQLAPLPLTTAHTSSFHNWLLKTYAERYTTTSVQTFLFSIILFTALIGLKVFSASLQHVPIISFLIPSPLTSPSSYSFFDVIWDFIIALGIVVILQILIQLVVVATLHHVSSDPFPTHILPIKLLNAFGILPFIYGFNTTNSTQPQQPKCFWSLPFQKLRFSFIFILLTTLAIGLFCTLFHIPTTRQPSSNLFSYHSTTPLVSTSFLSPLSWFQSSPPIFWINRDGYLLDCLATDPAQQFSFSTSLPDHSYSAYNSHYYPTPAQLGGYQQGQQPISTLLNQFVNDDNYDNFRSINQNLTLAAFSSRYDVEVGAKSDPIVNIANTDGKNLYDVPTTQRPFIPTNQNSQGKPVYIPRTTPTHATPTPLTPEIIKDSIPVLSLYQYHRFQHQVHKNIQIAQTPTTISIHTSLTSDPTVAFFGILILSITAVFYKLFRFFAIPLTKQTFPKFILIILISIFTTLITSYFIMFPLIHISQYLFSWIPFANTATTTNAIFHNIQSHSVLGALLAITLPADTITSVLPETHFQHPEFTICPDNFALGLIPISKPFFTSATFFSIAFILVITAVPFVYFVYRVIFLIETPLNYNNHVLQALYLNTTKPTNTPLHLVLSRFTGHHPVEHLLHLAKTDSLYISLNNSTYLPELPPSPPSVWATLANIQTPFLQQRSIYLNALASNQINPPQYTEMFMDFLIEGCFNTTTARIYDLLFQTKQGSGKKGSKVVSNADIVYALSCIVLPPTSPQFTSKPSNSTLCNAFQAVAKPIDQFLATTLSSTTHLSSTHPTLLLQLIAATFLLPTNLAMISGTITPVRDQPNRFIHSANNTHVSSFYLHHSIIALLQLQLALEDLVRFTAHGIDPFGFDKRAQTDQNSTIRATAESPDDQFLTPRSFGYLVESSHQLSLDTRNVLKQLYTPATTVIQELINRHFSLDKVTLNIALPQSLIPLFRNYLAQRS